MLRASFRLLTFMTLMLACATAPGAAPTDDRVQRYIVVLHDPPLAAYDGGALTLPVAREEFQSLQPDGASGGSQKIDVRSPQAQAYLRYLEHALDTFRLDAAVLLGQTIEPIHIYRTATNGVALDLTPAEAAALADSPYVKSVNLDTLHRLETDAGPEWIGANEIWSGASGFAASKGAGVVVGVIDSGINWDHPSFADPANDGYDHVNPLGQQLGLCSEPDVPCNDKIIGVYDFVVDNPDTEVVEEGNRGKDNSGHGSHVAAIAVGNRLNVTLNGNVNTVVSGVAPHANVVSYRVCYIGDPPNSKGGCQGSAILAAIDQAIADGVDVINYSIGTDAFSPWTPGNIPRAFLNARNAGIFVVTSSGNSGPNSSTTGSPANAPWVVAAGNATHNRVFASLVQNLSGGATPAPDDLVGASLSGGLSKRKIVHARDFGFPLCATGPAELAPTCGGNVGNSNPWKGQKPFNGEIVVCDRGIYGRIEKGKNVLLAGAGGYILANTDSEAESLMADNHCLPASHIGDQDGDTLRAWLASGSNHQGSISGFSLARLERFGDQVARSSSRGPGLSPVENILKPNVIAPGSSILAAAKTGGEFSVLTGTSMASPHIAGAAALVRAVHPSWSVAQVASSLETTATAVLAKDTDGSLATPHARGAGRPQLGEAVNAGLFLDVTGAQFNAANPAAGGNPKNLNLSGLVDSSCQASCTFTRTVKDQMGGGRWTATPAGFPAGVVASIAPANFTLGNGASRTLTITVDVEPSLIVGEWIYGEIRLAAAGSADQSLTMAVFSSGGKLPEGWTITDPGNSGSRTFPLEGLALMPDATFTSGGLVLPKRTVKTIKQDPTSADPAIQKGRFNQTQNDGPDDPFDGGEGVFTVWHNLPQGGLWLHAETLASTAVDLDLFVGRDDNGNGRADEEEQLCKSTSPTDLEVCDLYNLPPGNYWVVVQNWAGTNPAGDEATLISAAVGHSDTSNLLVSGPGVVPAEQAFTLRASWSDVNALPGQTVYGAVGVGTRRQNPNNVGVIPVRLTRTGITAAQTLPLMNGKDHRLALDANAMHDRMFVDVPPGVTSLKVSAEGSSSAQSNGLSLQLYRQDFGAALADPPFAQLPGGLASVASASGGGGTGPVATVGGPVTPGRYFVKLSNGSASAASVTVGVEMSSSPSTFPRHRGLWDADRGNAQGMEWNGSGAFDFSLWYTYDEAGQPTWYIASGAAASGNIWTADLYRVTNNGSIQQENRVGTLSVTFIAADRVVYSYSLLGQAGFDPMHPNSANTCPNLNGGPKSYTGHWFRGLDGLGGATVLVYASAQAQVHYLYDARGEPRWLIAADGANQSATAQTIPLLQFSGYCATCTPSPISYAQVGQVNRVFSNETSGNWSLDFSLATPLNQSVDRSESIVKLSDTLNCQ